jgi:glucosylceramidase
MTGDLKMSSVYNLVVTAKDTEDRLTTITQLAMEERPAANKRQVIINPDQSFQTILGFGGAFTEAAAYTLHRLPKEKQAEVLGAYFNSDTGHGYTLCRTHINSCDFSLGNYAYAEVAGDTELEYFSIDRDRQHLLAMIKDALALSKEPLKLMATPWSPPAWMKTNGEMNHGGKLKPEYQKTWANYFGRYIQEYAQEGVPIWGVSVQNEPLAVQTWDSCIYTAAEERDFVRDHLGPTLERMGLGEVKIIVWDHNRDLIFKRTDTILSDPAAAKYVWGVGFHWYENPLRFDNLSRVHQHFPQTNLVFTEGCQEGGPHLGEWGLGERYAHNMINDLNHWTVGWIDWNMLLDEEGGPNHVGNYCSAQIIADTRSGELLYQSSYYYFGHISRYVRPGAVRLGSEVRDRKLEACAFQNVDGRLVVVVLNRSDKPRDFSLVMNNLSMDVPCPPRSILTLAE